MSRTPFWMYWHESMGMSETDSLRGFMSDFCSGHIVHLETRVTEEEGILLNMYVCLGSERVRE